MTMRSNTLCALTTQNGVIASTQASRAATILRRPTPALPSVMVDRDHVQNGRDDKQQE